jgi:hypothetical protein
VYKITDLFRLFDIFQTSLYANDPDAVNDEGSEAQDSQRFTYEESILVTLLGKDYLQFINEETGEWEQDDSVILTFQDLFEKRIRFLFEADSLEK